MRVEPYLFFEGRCDEAIEFYRRVLGAEPAGVMRYDEAPPAAWGGGPGGAAGVPAHLAGKVMHGSIRIGESTVMVSDGHCDRAAHFQGFALTLTVEDAARAREIFAALAEGGQVRMPIAETFFSPCFGMVADRFGVLWMVMAE